MDGWFPWCYVYKESDRNRFDFFDRLDSKRHFEKVKGIFNIETPQDFIELIDNYQESKKNEQRMRYSRGFQSVPFVHELIDIKKIATNR